MSSFCNCKNFSHFFSKNISVYAIFKDQSFNYGVHELTTSLALNNWALVAERLAFLTSDHEVQGSELASVAQLDAPSNWRPGGRGFNPRRGRQHSFMEIDHEIFSMVILSLLLIQEGQLSVSGERMCTILVNRLEDKACPVNVWLGKLTALDMTPLG